MVTDSKRPRVVREPERVSFRAMAADVTLSVHRPDVRASAALDDARSVFRRVESACSRFDPAGRLMRANREPDRWHEVPGECADAVREAARAHRETGGIFDPRTLETLLRFGFDRRLPFAQGPAEAPRPRAGRRPQPWRPRIEERAGRHRVHLDGAAIDLGGIREGLAVRWAWERLRHAGDSVRVDAGGTCRLSGPGPDGRGWHVGVQDPFGSENPVAVLVLTDTGCATSSNRGGRRRRPGRAVHHRIGPRRETHGGDGVLAVTVIDPDPVWAEVWSRVLLTAEPDEVAGVAAMRDLAVLWVEADGTLRVNDAARPFVLWTASDGYLAREPSGQAAVRPHR